MVACPATLDTSQLKFVSKMKPLFLLRPLVVRLRRTQDIRTAFQVTKAMYHQSNPRTFLAPHSELQLRLRRRAPLREVTIVTTVNVTSRLLKVSTLTKCSSTSLAINIISQVQHHKQEVRSPWILPRQSKWLKKGELSRWSKTRTISGASDLSVTTFYHQL